MSVDENKVVKNEWKEVLSRKNKSVKPLTKKTSVVENDKTLLDNNVSPQKNNRTDQG